MARARICTPDVFEFDSYVTGHHIYKEIWSPETNETLFGHMEPENPYDLYAVAIVKDGKTVGHIPKEHSKHCTVALLAGGSISCEVKGKRENKRNRGLEVPCRYKIKGPYFLISNVRILIEEYLERVNINK